jgi:hypothetical protein
MSSPVKSKESYAKPSKQKYRKLSELVTDETVIPALPSLLLQAPQQQQLTQKCQKLRDEMGVLNNGLKAFIQETIAVIKNKKSQTRISIGPLQSELDEKIKKFKDVKVFYDEARANLEEKKRLVAVQVRAPFISNRSKRSATP